MTETAKLSSAQRAHLKGLAHDKKPVVQVGSDGVSEGVIRQVEEALTAHELIKIKLARPPDKKTAAEELAAKCGAEFIGLIGHTVILYKKHPTKPRIQVP